MIVIPLESSVKPSLADKTQLSAITSAFSSATNIVACCGAGISTSAGIRDFRSKDGLYAQPPSTSTRPGHRKAPTLKGIDLFSYSSYSTNELFEQHLIEMNELHRTSTTLSPTPTHAFFGLLKRKNKLKRIYTQNVDNLEDKVAGVTSVKLPGCCSDMAVDKECGDKKLKGVEGDVVQLHGSLNHVRCTLCSYVTEWTDEHSSLFREGVTMDCPECQARGDSRILQGKRKLPIKSFIRPSILLYNDAPSPVTLKASETISRIVDFDSSSGVDLLLVMGSSLKVVGFKSLIKNFAKLVKSGKNGKRKRLCVFVNKERASKEWQDIFDYQILGKTDDFVKWIENDWKRSRPQDFQSQVQLSNLFGMTKALPSSSKNQRKPLSPLGSNSGLEKLLATNRPTKPFPGKQILNPASKRGLATESDEEQTKKRVRTTSSSGLSR